MLLGYNHILLVMSEKLLFLYIGQLWVTNPIVTPWIEKTSLVKTFRRQTFRKNIKCRIFKNLLFAVFDKKQYFCPH